MSSLFFLLEPYLLIHDQETLRFGGNEGDFRVSWTKYGEILWVKMGHNKKYKVSAREQKREYLQKRVTSVHVPPIWKGLCDRKKDKESKWFEYEITET